MSGLSPAIQNLGGIDMAVYVPLKSSVAFRLNTGVDGNGKMVVRSVNISRVSPSIDADSLKSATDALGELLAFPVFAVERVSTDSVEM